MSRVNKVIDVSVDQLDKAKETAVALSQGTIEQKNIVGLFYSNNLVEVENGIKALNEFAEKSWLLSSLLLYTMVYNNDLYLQSGLSWDKYMIQARERLGMDARDITESLSSARFFILHYDELIKFGWQPIGNRQKLARAELAYTLSGSLQDTVKHLVNDSWRNFKAWYKSFKIQKKLKYNEMLKRDDVKILKNHFYIGENEAVVISDNISDTDKERLNYYIQQIFEAIKDGYEPAIIPTYDKKEASLMIRLRDRYKQVLNEEQAQNANKLSEIYTKTLNASYTPEQRKSFCLQGQAELQRMSGNRLAENDRIRYSKLFEIGIDEINNPSRATNKSGNKELINWIKDNADAYINAWRNGRYSNAYAMQQALHNAYQQQLDSYSDLSDEERQDLYLNGQIIISNVVKAASESVYKEYPDLQKQVDNLAKESLKGLYTEEASSYIMKFLLDKIAESNVKYFDVNKLQDEINKKKNYLTNDGLNQLRLATDKKGKSKYEYKNQKDIGKLFDTINENDFTFTDVYGNRQTVPGADDILNAEGGYVQTGKGIIAKFLNLSPEEMRRIKDRETVEENDLKSERTFSYKGVDYRFRPKKNDKGKVIDYELYNAKTGEVLANGDTLKKIDKYGYMLDNPTDKNLEKMNITRSNWNKKTVKEKIDLITQSKL